jgi:hypothetical protein
MTRDKGVTAAVQYEYMMHKRGNFLWRWYIVYSFQILSIFFGNNCPESKKEQTQSFINIRSLGEEKLWKKVKLAHEDEELT